MGESGNMIMGIATDIAAMVAAQCLSEQPLELRQHCTRTGIILERLGCLECRRLGRTLRPALCDELGLDWIWLVFQADAGCGIVVYEYCTSTSSTTVLVLRSTWQRQGGESPPLTSHSRPHARQ
jgi:hypothetical protein